jgi:hypothetical protein
VAQTLVPAARTASETGTGVDLAGYHAASIYIVAGTIADGTHTPVVQESDDNVTFTDVAAEDLQGTLANIASNTVQEIGYIGSKRYIRVNVNVTGATTGGVYAAFVVRGRPYSMPA